MAFNVESSRCTAASFTSAHLSSVYFRIILLSNDSYLLVGKSLEEATYLTVLYENAAQLHILARSVGNIQPIATDAAKESCDFLLQDPVINGTFNSWAYELLRTNSEIMSWWDNTRCPLPGVRAGINLTRREFRF